MVSEGLFSQVLVQNLIRHIRGNSSNSTNGPWFKSDLDDRDIQDAEVYEFVEHETRPRLSPRSLGKQAAYEEGSSIDWVREEAAERERKRVIRSRRGLHGLLGVVLDSAGLWLVIILTGVGVGFLGAWLDVLVKWCVLYCCGISSSDGQSGTGWEIYEKDDVGMDSSTTRLHAVVGWIVSAKTRYMRYYLTQSIQPERSVRNGRRGVNTSMSAASSDNLSYRPLYTSRCR